MIDNNINLSDKSKEFLEIFEINLQYYKQGVIDQFEIYESNYKKTIRFYDDKIIEINREIEKRNK